MCLANISSNSYTIGSSLQPVEVLSEFFTICFSFFYYELLSCTLKLDHYTLKCISPKRDD